MTALTQVALTQVKVTLTGFEKSAVSRTYQNATTASNTSTQYSGVSNTSIPPKFKNSTMNTCPRVSTPSAPLKPRNSTVNTYSTVSRTCHCISRSKDEELRYHRGKTGQGKTQLIVYSKQNPDVPVEVYNENTLKKVYNTTEEMEEMLENMTNANLNIFLLFLVDTTQEQWDLLEYQKKMLSEWKSLQGFRYFGLTATATKKELKSAYFKMSMKLHPDKGGCPEEFARMKELYNTCLAAIKFLKELDMEGDENTENGGENKENEDENTENSDEDSDEDPENPKKKNKDPNCISWEIDDRDQMMNSIWALRQRVVALQEMITTNNSKLVKLSKTYPLIPLSQK